jgi:hypothetical protein
MARGRKPLFTKAMSGGEKQKRYRAKKHAELEALKSTASLFDEGTMREEVRKELLESWAPAAKAERLAAERKQGRESAKKADRNYSHGRISGICAVAEYFVVKERVDIAQHILAHHLITHEVARGALESDRRVKSITLEHLTKVGAFDPPGRPLS